MDKVKHVFFRLCVILLVMTLICLPLVEVSSPEFVILVITAALNGIVVALGIGFAVYENWRKKK